MKFWDKPSVKNVTLAILTILIGCVGSALGTWDYKSDKYFYFKIIFLSILLGAYVWALIHYSKTEVNNNKLAKIYKQQNEMYEKMLSGMTAVYSTSSTNINKIIHTIREEGKIELKSWNFNLISGFMCEKIYEVLCLVVESKDIGVAYVRRIEEGNGDLIQMNAYHNKNRSIPTIHKIKRDINDPNGYHDAELFRRNKADWEILIDNNSVQDQFKCKPRTDRKKYNQYVGIPVMCDRDNGTKMVGLLEVMCFKDAKIADSVDEVSEIISKYLMPYAYLFLMMHKIEKAVTAVPEVSENK